MKTSVRLRRLRESLGMSQSELARRAKVGRLTVWRAERGRPLTIRSLIALARALGVSAGELVA